MVGNLTIGTSMLRAMQIANRQLKARRAHATRRAVPQVHAGACAASSTVAAPMVGAAASVGVGVGMGGASMESGHLRQAGLAAGVPVGAGSMGMSAARPSASYPGPAPHGRSSYRVRAMHEEYPPTTAASARPLASFTQAARAAARPTTTSGYAPAAPPAGPYAPPPAGFPFAPPPADWGGGGGRMEDVRVRGGVDKGSGIGAAGCRGASLVGDLEDDEPW